jgi:cellobiose-specific phosphotransferase system component IIB
MVSGTLKVKTYIPTEKLPNVDAIIVTPIFQYKKISKTLKKSCKKSKINCPIISLETILCKTY